jgi:hypothetical protein
MVMSRGLVVQRSRVCIHYSRGRALVPRGTHLPVTQAPARGVREAKQRRQCRASDWPHRAVDASAAAKAVRAIRAILGHQTESPG